MRRILIALQLLSVFDDPDWSLVYVRETVDFLSVLDQFIEKIEKAAAELNLDENHALLVSAKKMAMAKAYCAEKMAAQSGGAQSGTAEYKDPNFIDDMWFQDLFGLFDYQNDTGHSSL